MTSPPDDEDDEEPQGSRDTPTPEPHVPDLVQPQPQQRPQQQPKGASRRRAPEPTVMLSDSLLTSLSQQQVASERISSRIEGALDVAPTSLESRWCSWISGQVEMFPVDLKNRFYQQSFQLVFGLMTEHEGRRTQQQQQQQQQQPQPAPQDPQPTIPNPYGLSDSFLRTQLYDKSQRDNQPRSQPATSSPRDNVRSVRVAPNNTEYLATDLSLPSCLDFSQVTSENETFTTEVMRMGPPQQTLDTPRCEDE